MEEKSIRLTYHLRKKQPIEHGIGIFLDLKYYFAVCMIVGYGIYALTGQVENMIKDALVLALAVVGSYILRNKIANNIILLTVQFCLILSSNIWCKHHYEKVICTLFLIGWSVYSLAVRLKENKERTFQNEGLFAILLGIPMEALADYYHYEPVKSLVFWLGFLMILTHFLIKYMIDFMKYFEQAGQVNITIRQIKLKSHLLLAGYGVIGMGIMLIMSRLPLQGVWNQVKHGIYLLLQKFFHMLEGESTPTRWDMPATPMPEVKADITLMESDSIPIDLSWVRPLMDLLFEILSVVITVAVILYSLKLIYTIVKGLNKKEKGIEEEKEFIHLSERNDRIKKEIGMKTERTESTGNNRSKVRKLFKKLMIKQGIGKYNNWQYMTSHEMCHLNQKEELDLVERIYQKARYSKADISEEEVKKVKEQYEQMKKR